MSTKTKIDLTTASPAEQAALLRRSVVEWNDAVRAARRQQPYWRARLGGASLAACAAAPALTSNMCRKIRALRAERDAETRRADDNDDVRKRAEAERDALAAELARVMPVVEAAKLLILNVASESRATYSMGHGSSWELMRLLGDAVDAYRASTNDTKGEA